MVNLPLLPVSASDGLAVRFRFCGGSEQLNSSSNFKLEIGKVSSCLKKVYLVILRIFIYTLQSIWIRQSKLMLKLKTLDVSQQFRLLTFLLRLFFARPHLSVGLFFVLSRNSIMRVKLSRPKYRAF